MTEEKELQMPRKKPRWWILVWIALGLILILTAAAVLLFLVNRFSLVITIQGEPEVMVEYGNDYTDAGAKAYLVGTVFLKSGYELELTTRNEVKADTLGTYCVTFWTEFLWMKSSAKRMVTVVDTQKPVIELVSSPDAYTIPGTLYQEEGFSAIDNYDGDLTSQVVRREENGMVIYTVADSSGNETTVTREIVYFDPVPPELMLIGESDITITAGHAFTDPGYTAVDNCDGDLTDRVEVTGNVDIYRSGSYQLDYRVVDSYGNEAAVSRIVRVTPVPQPDVVKPEGKVIYLTFDDGPGSHTGRLLDVLNQFNVKATFFVVSTGNYDMLKRIAAEGHSLAIHSTTHKYEEIYSSEEAFFNDLNTMKNIIKEQTGVDTTLVRFPGGSSNLVSDFNPGIMTRLTQAVTDNGYQYFDWNVDSNDAGGASSSEEVFQNVVNGCSGKDISIVLQHDIKEFSVDAVEKILIWGIANGYTFLPLDPTSPTCHHGVNN